MSSFGEHQAGIATPAQDRLVFAAFDVTAGERAQLRALLQRWTAAAAALTAGERVPVANPSLQAPPGDTGEADGLPAARLTLTAGFGPSLFNERLGLSERRPVALAALPALPGESLDPERSDGDLAVQACADDPQVAFHAVRNLARLARGSAVMRWLQHGFGPTASTSAGQVTPRNLMGFKDGTRDIHGEDAAAMAAHVWMDSDGDRLWMQGGSYLVARRIRMLIEAWDRDSLADQQNVFGRSNASGAPLTGQREFDPPDLAARDGSLEMLIPANAQIRLASRENNNGLRILRRGYSYTDGMDPVRGELAAGLFSIAFQRDPRTQFVALQRQLGAHDALTEYIIRTASGLYACPPGVRGAGDYWGAALFA